MYRIMCSEPFYHISFCKINFDPYLLTTYVHVGRYKEFLYVTNELLNLSSMVAMEHLCGSSLPRDRE